MNERPQRNRRAGQVVALAPIMLGVLGGIVALTADVGEMFVEKARLQNAADAASLAGAYVLAEQCADGQSEEQARAAALTEAAAIKEVNRAEAGINVEFGNWQQDGTFVAAGIETPATAVRVTTTRNHSAPGGALALTFARLLGFRTCDVAALAACEATGQIAGFRGGLRPFAVDKNSIVPIGQMMTFYEQKKLAPGNFGLLDFNGGANGTPDLAQWIRYGYDGEVAVGDDGYCWIDGDPGFRAALKDDIQAIWGEEIFVPVYDQVTGNGANASYRVIGFLGIVITDSQLTGKNKYIKCSVTQMRSVHDVVTGGNWTTPNLRKIQLVH
jgi:hypothetical protein